MNKPLVNYYVWTKRDVIDKRLDRCTRVEAYHPEVAAATEIHAQSLASFASQADHGYTSAQDYVMECLVVSEWPDARNASEYWFRVDTQMVRIPQEET